MTKNHYIVYDKVYTEYLRVYEKVLIVGCGVWECHRVS